MQQKSFLFYPHQKQYRFELTQKISFCFNCSSAILTDISGKEISTIKPLNHHIHQETSLPIFLTISDEHKPYCFLNKSGYIKIRKQIILGMKQFCNKYKLSNKTYFLALDYFDRICSRIHLFDKEDLKQISEICIIMAWKFLENITKAIDFNLKEITKEVSSTYAKDELYLINLLNYDLYNFTSYDILMDILNCGFLFNDEQFSTRKMESFYREIENILYLFSQSKYYIDMTHKEIALSIIGFVRENLGLIAFSKNIQIGFMNEFVDIHNYLNCLNKIRKCFKFNVDRKSNNNNHSNNHSDSNTEANSDGNSDNNISENNSNYKNNNNIGKKIVNKNDIKEN